MDTAERSQVRQMVLACRRILWEEYDQILRLHGLLPDKTVNPPADRQAMQKRLQEALHREGNDYIKARKRYLRGMAYTFLNRIMALRVAEGYALIKETVQTRPEFGDRSLRERDLADFEPALLAHPEAFTHRSLEDAFAEARQTIPLLFRSDDPYALVLPRLLVIRQVRELLRSLPNEVWCEFETLGWAYQYFKSEENDEIRKRMRGAPEPDEAPIINQFFTVAWIVKALSQNTIGRLWVESHSDSSLQSKLNYFIPIHNDFPAQKTVKIDEFRVLDPACGSGHFLLGSFDLLLEMWHEAYPDLPTWAIPAKIIEANLYGVDIDLRACQIAAAALYLKARTTFERLKGNDSSADFQPRRINIVCADIRFTDGGRRERFLAQFEGDPQLQRIVAQTLQACEQAFEIGSLLDIREPIQKLFQQRVKKPSDFKPPVEQLALFHLDSIQLSLGDVPASVPRQWTIAEIFALLQDYLRQATQRQDMGAEFFGMDAEQALYLVDVLSQDYDVILMNPPYGGMTTNCKNYAKKHFPRTANDAYSAFIEQAVRLAKPGGCVGALTGRTFLFLKTFQKLREEILRQDALPELVWDLGFNVLDEATARYAAFTLRRRYDRDGVAWQQHPVTFFRLLDWAWDEKRVKFEEALAEMKKQVAV